MPRPDRRSSCTGAALGGPLGWQLAGCRGTGRRVPRGARLPGHWLVVVLVWPCGECTASGSRCRGLATSSSWWRSREDRGVPLAPRRPTVGRMRGQWLAKPPRAATGRLRAPSERAPRARPGISPPTSPTPPAGAQAPPPRPRSAPQLEGRWGGRTSGRRVAEVARPPKPTGGCSPQLSGHVGAVAPRSAPQSGKSGKSGKTPEP